MASFVVETFVAADVPDRFAADVEGIRKAAKAKNVDGPFHVVRSYFVPGDEMGFHVVEAASAEHVARVVALAGIEVERIVEAIGVEPGHPVDAASDGPT